MKLLVSGFLFINLMFFLLSGIAGSSMATVDGAARPYLFRLLLPWILAVMPYIFYTGALAVHKRNQRKFSAVTQSIAASAWLAFPGGIALFLFFGSRISWAVFPIPLLQMLVALCVYLKYSK